MVYKAVDFKKTAPNATADHFTHHRTTALDGSGNPAADRVGNRRSAGCGARVGRPGLRSKPGKAGRGGRAAGGAGFLGPQAASGPARSGAPLRGKISDRNRLPPVHPHPPRPPTPPP